MYNAKGKKVGPKKKIKPEDVKGVDYLSYSVNRTITRPALVKWLQKYCDEKNINPNEAVHILAMDMLRHIYGTPPNLLQQVIEATIVACQKKG